MMEKQLYLFLSDHLKFGKLKSIYDEHCRVLFYLLYIKWEHTLTSQRLIKPMHIVDRFFKSGLALNSLNYVLFFFYYLRFLFFYLYILEM